MIRLLQLLIDFLSPLFDEYGFYIKSSNNDGSSFRGASILLASKDMELFLAIERDEITLQFRSAYDKKKNWLSLSALLRYVGEDVSIDVLEENVLHLLRMKLPEIIGLLSEENAEKTIKALSQERTNSQK